MSICVFYARLTYVRHCPIPPPPLSLPPPPITLTRKTGLAEFELRVKLGYALIAATWVATQLCILLGCQPRFRDNWRIYPEPPNLCQPAISKLNLYATVVLNVASDAYLMSIPVPMLWRAHRVAPWRRLCLLAVFCAGVIVMAAGIMRCYIVLKNPHTGVLKAGTWACRESFLAVLTANAPVVYPTVRITVNRVTSSIFSHGAASKSGFFPWRSTLSRKGRRSGGGGGFGRMGGDVDGGGGGGVNGGGGSGGLVPTVTDTTMTPVGTTTGGSSVALGTWASCEATGGKAGRERDVEAGCWGKAHQ
ncbi:hypothetical protein BK809_0007805 [Diplodia seriata]|uniref:Rhodopsin domain-containing protein n=1 Tax=Diplodia seriata TaxID=420778 RepID=A0A1S8BJP3_9PEZI|nr:hypothetical protein BK809_0007805 [Diplodia seriata]